MHLFTTNKNLIISAKTASGKTEAAFLPILSQIVEKKGVGVSAIYVGPLKALSMINSSVLKSYVNWQKFRFSNGMGM